MLLAVMFSNRDNYYYQEIVQLLGATLFWNMNIIEEYSWIILCKIVFMENDKICDYIDLLFPCEMILNSYSFMYFWIMGRVLKNNRTYYYIWAWQEG